MDMLEVIFASQKKFQDKYNYHRPTHELCSAMASECMELWGISGGKWWKKTESSMREQKEELADILHFFVATCINMNITPKELYASYIRKLAINYQRQNSNY
jgi:dimeric dUTPase (all-alpha-NTP-PPase superfamily)